jgi:hypothetical protein
LVTSTNGIQSWTVPSTGFYQITAAGAKGGGTSGGSGAVMRGNFLLNQGEVLQIMAGQQGSTATNGHGGGGGTFVVYAGATDDDDILIIAGGGGTCWNKTDNAITRGSTATSGTNGERAPGWYTGGSNGGGGEGQQNTSGGGGGYSGDAWNSTTNSDNIRGVSFLNGGTAGGTTTSFGGGGGANTSSAARCGGGGGYSGGGAGFTGNSVASCAGGGGSFNAGTNQLNVAGSNTGHGYVIIEKICL